ncbi:TPA: hypothetical protein N0F65_011212 [Lagenidium giganteum]|uniref:non-specific serine/threonine protein kinase n=1 Tax=Lagenidium giganteum TaxID=4803 RepID=A0AAV2YRA5_9STRA|nr:TPA: hypothetical protein N0F65_011212 [Lagenidium giganteum]
MGCFDCLFCFKGNRDPDSPDPKPVAPGAAKVIKGKAPRKVTDSYTLGKVIGSGSYSVVRASEHKATKEKFAIKCIQRSQLTEEDDEAIIMEVNILKQMDHPNIMKLHDFFTEPDYYYLVTEFVSGGELFDRIVEKESYTEKEARDLVKILLGAIKYCHDKGVVHRDLKPENLLLMSKDDDASIKLADFGFAKKVTMDDSGLVTTCGTPGYVAPEILEGASYGKPVDIWSIGVITYILLCGYPPFHDDAQAILFRKIKRGKFQFDSPYWDNISNDAKDFIKKMLVVNPKDRAPVDALMAHAWIVGQDVATVPLEMTMKELRRFHARKRFKAAVHSVQATISLGRILGAAGSTRSSATLQENSSASNPNNKLYVEDSEVSL